MLVGGHRIRTRCLGCSITRTTVFRGPVFVKVKVYYADTDAGGVVYYGNYLRWLEMGRFELLENHGMSVEQLDQAGILFAVAHLEIDYHVSARLGDTVELQCEVQRVRRVRFTVNQRVLRTSDNELLVSAKVMLACVNRQGKLIALPDDVADTLRNAIP